MLYAYIAVALFTVVLIIVLVLSILWLTGRVTQNIRNRSIDLIGCYDNMLEQKSAELKKLDAQVKKLSSQLKPVPAEPVKPAPVVDEKLAAERANSALKAVEKIGASEYRSSDISDIYRKIRSGFNYEPSGIIRDIEKAIDQSGLKEGPASVLMKALDFQTVFRLSQLDHEDQYRLLMDAVPASSRDFVEDYYNSVRTFDAIRFYDYIRSEAANESRDITLYVPEKNSGDYIASGAKVQVMPGMLEGFMIEANNTVFDYCIREREIS